MEFHHHREGFSEIVWKRFAFLQTKVLFLHLLRPMTQRERAFHATVQLIRVWKRREVKYGFATQLSRWNSSRNYFHADSSKKKKIFHLHFLENFESTRTWNSSSACSCKSFISIYCPSSLAIKIRFDAPPLEQNFTFRKLLQLCGRVTLSLSWLSMH